jgi:hypothetical protein
MSRPIYGSSTSNTGSCILRPPEGQDINTYLTRLYSILYQLNGENDKDKFNVRILQLQSEIQTVINNQYLNRKIS